MPEAPVSLLTYTTVQTWLGSLQRQAGLALDTSDEHVQILAAFCAYVGQSPEAIIAACMQQTAEGKMIRSRSRQYYAEQITAFQAQVVGDRRYQVRCGSVVRSFLIHNGVMLQAGWQYRPGEGEGKTGRAGGGTQGSSTP